MTSIVEYNEADSALATLRERYAGKTYAVETGDGMRDAKEARADIRRYRIELEKVRKEIKAPSLARCQEIDSEAKRITKELLSLEEPIDRSIKGEEERAELKRHEREQAEMRENEDRNERIRRTVAAISETAFKCIGGSSEYIRRELDDLRRIDTSEESIFGDPEEHVTISNGGEIHEFINRAEVARRDTVSKLERMLDNAIEQEKARSRLAELEERHAQAEDAKQEAERSKFIVTFSSVVDDLQPLRREARNALAEIILRFSDIPELSPVISAIRAYLEGNHQ